MRSLTRSILSVGCIAAAWIYAGLLVLWFSLHAWFGDAVWWLALLSAFTPFFFVPLLLLLPISLLHRKGSLRVGVALPIAVFLWLYGSLFLPSLPMASAVSKDTLTVMSFNVWGFSWTSETAQAIVDGGVPDIVALQELGPDMAQVVAQDLGHIYPYHIVDFGPPWSRLGLFSRYPLRELDAERFSDRTWQVQVVQVDVEGQGLTVYNVHMPGWSAWHHLEPDVPLRDQIGDTVRRSVQADVEARKELARWLLDDIAGRSNPIIVLGDFNSTDQSDVYHILTEHLTDAHRAAGWGFGHTFPAYRGRYQGIPIVPRQVRIDMILYSRDLQALNSHVGSAHGESDHLPVMAELIWHQPALSTGK